MKQQLTIEQLKKAREIGATHISPNNECWVYKEISGRPFLFRLNGHVSEWEECYFVGENPFSRLLSEIDFSPLGEPERMTGGYRDLGKSDIVSMKDKYPKYYKDVAGLNEIDVYQVHNLFDIRDASGCLQHASKKLLLSGVRTGNKSKHDDIREARDTLTRWLDINSNQ